MNPILDHIKNRVSSPRLCEPAPEPEVLKAIFEASLNVPDHLLLKPWRFLCIGGDDRQALAQLFKDAESHNNPEASEEELDKKGNKVFRAPLIIVAICKPEEHPKVPIIEQQLSTACVVHNLGLGLRSLGFASVWRTGSFAFDPFIHKGLGLQKHESIIGFLYVGSTDGTEKNVKVLDPDEFVSQWPT